MNSNVVELASVKQLKDSNKLLLKTLKLHNSWLSVYMGRMDVSNIEMDHLLDLYEATQKIITHVETK